MTLPSFYRVRGEDGRYVGLYSADELRAFKGRIRHSVQHGVPVEPPGYVHERPDGRLPAERFSVEALDDHAAPHPDGTTTWNPADELEAEE